VITANPVLFWDRIATRPDWVEYILPKRTPKQFDDEGDLQAQQIRQLAPVCGGHIIDYGCGVGRVSQPMSRHAARMTGLDICGRFIQEAQRRDKGTTYSLISDFKEESTADLVYCISVMQHNTLPNAHKIMADIFRLLKPGGWCVVSFAHGPVYREGLFIHKFSNAEVQMLASQFERVQIVDGNLVRYGGYTIPEGQNNELFLLAQKGIL
jgi:2-polyprenyl-3-methyl-5-hydroxy-6-metoxy-1,4-benzoquinol methylase